MFLVGCQLVESMGGYDVMQSLTETSLEDTSLVETSLERKLLEGKLLENEMQVYVVEFGDGAIGDSVGEIEMAKNVLTETEL